MKVVLQICCGVCAAGVVTTLMDEGHEVTGYFCNPNIYPELEYRRRLAAARTVATMLSFPLITAPYNNEEWQQLCAPYAAAPEGGERCEHCFRLRLESTHRFMLSSGAEAFTTTLTISPHKSAETVNRVGRELGGDSFMARDFKKKDGFKRAIEAARQWGLYRQDYCGCIYSLMERRRQ